MDTTINANIVRLPSPERILWSIIFFLFFLGVLIFVLINPQKIFSKYGKFTSISFILVIIFVSIGLFSTLLTFFTRGKYRATFLVSRFFVLRLIMFTIIALIIYAVGHFSLKWIGQAEKKITDTSTTNIKLSITELGTIHTKPFAETPMPIEVQNNIASIYDLVGNDTQGKNYNFALSFWVYIQSQPLNTSAAYLKTNNVLSFCDSPKVAYNPSSNTFIVSILDSKTRRKKTIYEIANVQLQKWNHFVLNYDHGILDIFYNNHLVHSSLNVIPYLKANDEMLVVGQNNGIYGSVKNLNYFGSSLNVPQVSELFSSLL